MTSEKAMYWVVLGALALGAVNGCAARLGDSASQFAGGLLAMATQVSANAAEYADLALGRRESEINAPAVALARDQTRLACIESTLARNQAEMARLQALNLRVRLVASAPRVVTWPGGSMVIQVPQAPRIEPGDTF